METTGRVVARRRLELLTTLGQRLTADLRTPREVVDAALPLLRTNPQDLRAVEIHLPGVATRHSVDRLPQVPPVSSHDDVVVEGTADGHVAWVRLTTATDSADQPTMAVLLSENLEFDDAYRDFLRLIAVGLAQSLDRIAVRTASWPYPGPDLDHCHVLASREGGVVRRTSRDGARLCRGSAAGQEDRAGVAATIRQ